MRRKAGPSPAAGKLTPLAKGASGFGPAEASGMQMTARGRTGWAARLKPCPDEERQAEARRYVPLAAIATRELRSGHLQMGAPWLCQGGAMFRVAALNADGALKGRRSVTRKADPSHRSQRAQAGSG